MPIADPEKRKEYHKYYMKIYRREKVYKKRPTMKQLLMEVVRRQNQVDQHPFSETKKSDRVVATLKIVGDVKVTGFKEAPLTPFFQALGQEIYERYGRQFGKDTHERAAAIEGYIRRFIHTPFDQLERINEILKKHYVALEAMKILNEKEKAVDFVKDNFELPVGFATQENLEERHELWKKIMLNLEAEGFSYLAAKDAADFSAYHYEPNDPYQIFVGGTNINSLFKHFKGPNYIDHPDILAWRKREKEVIEYMNEVMAVTQEQIRIDKKKEEKEFRQKVIQLIEAGASDGRILGVFLQPYVNAHVTVTEDIKRYYWARIKKVMDEYRKKPRKIIKIKFVSKEQEEEPEDKEPTPEQAWISCMARASGRGVLYVTPFDEAVLKCTEDCFKMTGEQPSEKAFERVKKFWEPGYWKHHPDVEFPWQKPKERKVRRLKI